MISRNGQSEPELRRWGCISRDHLFRNNRSSLCDQEIVFVWMFLG